MRLLLDSHVLLWWASGDAALGAGASAAIGDAENDVFLSAATVWELWNKTTAGRLDMPDDLVARAVADGIEPLSISLAHAAEAAVLPRHHADPFDRMLVAQSRLEGLTLVTVDRILGRYDVRVLAAGR